MADFSGYSINIQALPTNTGLVYVGLTGMNIVTMENVLFVVAAPAIGSIPSWLDTAAWVPRGIRADELFVIAAVFGEGVIAHLTKKAGD